MIINFKLQGWNSLGNWRLSILADSSTAQQLHDTYSDITIVDITIRLEYIPIQRFRPYARSEVDMECLNILEVLVFQYILKGPVFWGCL